MNIKLARKTTNLIAIVAIFIQSLNPIALAQFAYAQEITPEPTTVVEETPIPTPAEEQTPSAELTTDPEPEQTITSDPINEPETTQSPTPAPTPEVTPEPTLAPEPTPEITPAPTSSQDIPASSDEAPPNETGPPATEPTDQILDGASTEAIPMPEVTTVSPEEGQLTVAVLQNVEAVSLDLASPDAETSAALVTDKPDYAPTDTVVITGTDFTPNETYTIVITSENEPAVHFETEVQADETGFFIYAYQLDGNYRPNYLVEAKDVDGQVVASTTFTDAATGTLYPNGQGTYTSWTGDEGDIDETGSPDCDDGGDGQDNISASTTGNRESVLINLTSIPDGSTITSVDVSVTYRNGNDGGADDGTFQTFTRLNGTELNSGVNLVATNTTCTSGTQTINVADTVKSGATTLEVGVLKTATDTSEVWVGTIRAVVTYTEVPAPAWPTSWATPGSCVADLSGESGVAPTEVDLVGTTVTPAVGFGSDSNYLYFRERINGNPGTVSNLHQYSWVVLFQTSTPQYQYLGSISGKAGNKVLLYDNPTHSPDSGGVDFQPLFNDPADSVVWEGASSFYGRVTGSGPYYIDWAIPVSELTSRGINVSTTKFFATSTNANNYNKDHLNCYEALSDLSIVKSDNPDPVTSGDTLTYTLTINNAGPDTASGVVVTDTLPAGYAITSVTPSLGSCSDTSAPSIQCELGSLASGGNATVTIVGTLTTGQVSVTNSAAVTLDTAVSTDTNSTNNSDSEDTAVIQQGTLRVIKSVVNDDGGQTSSSAFTLHVKSGGVDISGSPQAGSSTGTVYTLTGGTYAVSEDTLPPGYTFSGFSGNCDSQGNVTVVAGQEVTCTLTNDDQPGILIVKKVVTNDNGGTLEAEDFSFQVNGGGAVPFEADGQNDLTVDAGTYTITEPSVTGYSTTYDNCSQVEVSNGGTATCTITNDDQQASLTLVKNLPNDDGGTATENNFTVYIDGNQASWGSHLLNAGSYIVSEDTLGGYTAGNWGGDCDASGNVILLPGDQKTCEITNDDQPATLTLVKTLPNDNGGNETEINFAVYINGQVSSWGAHTVAAGSYTVSEDAVSGYSASGWGDDCDSQGNVTLLPGESKTCTITNDDIAPTITLVKEVINDNGGTASENDFGLTVDGGGVTSGQVAAVNANTPIAINEAGLTGYTFISLTGDEKCPSQLGGTVTLDEGEDITCTITNDDVQPKLTVTKVVVTDNGGTKQVGDFPLFVDQTPVTSGVQNGFDAGAYTVSETQDAGYTMAISGDCDAQGSVTLAVGDEKSCTIENDDIAPTLTLEKTVVNDNGGNASADDFQASIDASPIPWGIPQTLNVGSYTASESELSGYTAGSWGGDCNEDGSVTLAEGENKTCTIENDDQPGTIAGKKWNDEDGNGELGEEPGLAGWHVQLFLDEDGDLGDQVGDDAVTDQNGNYLFENIDAGDYFICEVPQEGWEQTYPTEPSCHAVTLESGENDLGNNFGNQQLPTEFQISKVNDASGAKGPGDTVIYTLTIYNPNRRTIFNVQVTDLLPEGFSYVGGSWTALSNERGDLKEGGVTPEPVYASPGVWQLGDMTALETVLLSFQAKISDTQLAGTYGDLAYAFGCQKDIDCLSTDPGALLALAVDPGYLDTNFVGTEVEVKKDNQPGASYNVINQVLGAATALPATGAQNLWLILASLMMIFGIGLVSLGVKERNKHE
ncbi:MAG: hypothetical protein A2900_02890 [Candidatus Chisholmbacteria bacterium RIFCSPLOWO2_01_FULL_50_28]|uniref:Gram-positive cocci surface proteins LPxTG domain-containing protein n=1 Tax=Candidatus Chisholmbacteria bacterium RIFCSPHIGHO2_01_FULL_52_32 TaxID=1797591 RepID=A0A1G1VT77_9BACT|nr:MAG: hypothetical protein A2786_03855 [Candidatus Chisholmbacteria bacterium RIFCSPHIGHO2_01_FULL_52_32]OGY20024.1 MAG: hypothetical protein A2900_02890 [Candidatus Chisholmbacteria bacterium RIFCSPLOWO2_01_FULL_50_28]